MAIIRFGNKGSVKEEVRFTYASTFPLNIKQVNVDKRVIKVSLIIDTAFNDGSSVASVGISGNEELLLKENENFLNIINQNFEVNPDYIVPSGFILVQLFLDPKTSTQGSGSVIIEYV